MSTEIFLFLLMVFLIGLVIGYFAHRYRWWFRWNLWGRWHQPEPEPMYLLTVRQEVEKGTYNSAQVVSQTMADDDLCLVWSALNLDEQLLEATGVIAQNRQWTMARMA